MRRSRRPLELFRRLAQGTRSGIPRGILRVWPLWEALEHRIWPIVPTRDTPESIMFYRPITYKGAPVQLPDGTLIRRGDRLVEIHLNNQRVAAVSKLSYWRVQTVLREDLRALAAWARTPEGADMKSIFAVTLLGVGGDRLGFFRRPLRPTLYVRLNAFFMSGLLAVYSPQGLDRLQRGTTPAAYPEEIWMPRHILLDRYGTAKERRGPGRPTTADTKRS